MNFGQAVENLNQGKKVRRSIWSGYWALENVDGIDDPMIIAVCKNGRRCPATAYQEDMLATDWEVVE